MQIPIKPSVVAPSVNPPELVELLRRLAAYDPERVYLFGVGGAP
jgi:hypothetical protein